MDYQRIRNLTTGILHTEVGHVYEDIELITGAHGIMTHQIPQAIQAMSGWLASQIKDSKFHESIFDPEHTGDMDLQTMNEEERQNFFNKFYSLN